MSASHNRHSSLPQLPLVILGSGYTGSRIYRKAVQAGWETFATSRKPDRHLGDLPRAHRIEFDLSQSSTWTSIPNPAHLLWCFPAVPFDLVQQFISTRTNPTCRLVVLGSTSAYLPNGQEVTEDTPINDYLPRVQTEEYLRTSHGAIIVRLAGLYGPGRHVLDWIRKGKIKNTQKWVNLLHVEDAAAICLLALERADKGDLYVASDGHPRTWREICSVASEKWQIPLPPPTAPSSPGKRIDIQKLRTELQYSFTFQDLFQALDHIETASH